MLEATRSNSWVRVINLFKCLLATRGTYSISSKPLWEGKTFSLYITNAAVNKSWAEWLHIAPQITIPVFHITYMPTASLILFSNDLHLTGEEERTADGGRGAEKRRKRNHTCCRSWWSLIQDRLSRSWVLLFILQKVIDSLLLPCVCMSLSIHNLIQEIIKMIITEQH